MDKYTSRTRRRRPVYLLISVAVAGIAAVALLAQQLSAERPMGELPFVPEEFAAETPICSALSEEAVLREELLLQLGGGKLLTVADARQGEDQEPVGIAADGLTAAQANALAYWLVPADYARLVLNDFAAPDPLLSDETLCRMRDDCFRLADRLAEVQADDRLLDSRVVLTTTKGRLDYSALWQQYDALRLRLINWAETYCPADKTRQCGEVYDRVRAALEVEYHTVKDRTVRRERAKQLSEADRLWNDVCAERMPADTASERLYDLWLNR